MAEKSLGCTEQTDGMSVFREPGVKGREPWATLRGSMWQWFRIESPYCSLSAESKQGQQGHGEAEEEAVGAGISAAVNVP